MELKECPVCGDEFPIEWGECPFCAATPKKRDKYDEDDFWN